jgi:hypothetical protein
MEFESQFWEFLMRMLLLANHPGDAGGALAALDLDRDFVGEPVCNGLAARHIVCRASGIDM